MYLQCVFNYSTSVSIIHFCRCGLMGSIIHSAHTHPPSTSRWTSMCNQGQPGRSHDSQELLLQFPFLHYRSCTITCSWLMMDHYRKWKLKTHLCLRCESTGVNLLRGFCRSVSAADRTKTRFALTKIQPGRFNGILRTSSEYPIEPNEGYILPPRR